MKRKAKYTLLAIVAAATIGLFSAAGPSDFKLGQNIEMLINMFRDLGAGIRNVFGGRSAGYEEELQQAREEVLAEMRQRAEALGADAIVGASIGYETFEGMIMTCCSGTAVRLRCV